MQNNPDPEHVWSFSKKLQGWQQQAKLFPAKIQYIQSYIDKEYFPVYNAFIPLVKEIIQTLVYKARSGRKNYYYKKALPAYIHHIADGYRQLLNFDLPFYDYYIDLCKELSKISGELYFELPGPDEMYGCNEPDWEEEDEADYLTEEMAQDRFLRNTLRKLEPSLYDKRIEFAEGVRFSKKNIVCRECFMETIYNLCLQNIKNDLLVASGIPVIQNRYTIDSLHIIQREIHRMYKECDYAGMLQIYLNWVEIIIRKIEITPECAGTELPELLEILENKTELTVTQIITYPFQRTHFILGAFLLWDQEEIERTLSRKKTELLYYVKETRLLQQLIKNDKLLKVKISETFNSSDTESIFQDPDNQFTIIYQN